MKILQPHDRPQANPPDLDIGVIYTYERHFMPRLLDTLARSGEGLSLRLLLVDNASRDEQAMREWRASFPKVHVVENAVRLGYAPNLNRILEASTARYVLLMNTDMYFDPYQQCLAKMARFMDDHPDCGLSICRIYHPDGSYGWPARRFQTLRTIAARRLRVGKLMQAEVDRYLYKDESPFDSFECDWVSGCFLFARREAVRDVGGFDTGFVKYFEDVDFCLRMARAGWKVMFHGGTYCYHCEQRASRKLLTRDAWRHMRSYLRWLAKWGFSPQPRPGLKKAA